MTPNELFNANQKLVYHCFHTYIRNQCPPSIYDDIIQEGFLGLWQASIRFDETRGFQFSTFAVSNIVGRMKRFLREQNSTIRILRRDWENGETDKYVTTSLDACLSDDNEDNLESILPAQPDDYEELTEELIDSFIEHERHRRYQCLNAKADIIERDLAVLEEYLYGVTFFEQPSQEVMSKKYGVSQSSVSKIIRKGRARFREFILSIDKDRTS